MRACAAHKSIKMVKSDNIWVHNKDFNKFNCQKPRTLNVSMVPYRTVPYSTVLYGTLVRFCTIQHLVNGHGYMVYGLISVYLRVWYL